MNKITSKNPKWIVYMDNGESMMNVILILTKHRKDLSIEMKQELCDCYYTYACEYNVDTAYELTASYNSSTEPVLSDDTFKQIITNSEHTILRREAFCEHFKLTEEEIAVTGIFKRRERYQNAERNKEVYATKQNKAYELAKRRKTQREIAAELNVSVRLVHKWLKEAGLSGNTASAAFCESISNDEYTKANILINNALKDMLKGVDMQIIGDAGSGKTTLVQRFISEKEGRVLVVAPTGMAASNYEGGQTIHGAFGLDIGALGPNYKKNVTKSLRNIDCIVIDEIGNVRFDVFNAVINCIKYVEEEQNRKIQLIVVGDFKQLQPVLLEEDKKKLKELWGSQWKGRSTHANATAAWKDCGFKCVKLSYIFRQEDKEYCEALNAARNDNIMVTKAYFDQFRDDSKFYESDAIHLCARNDAVNDINDSIVSEYIKSVNCESYDAEGTEGMDEANFKVKFHMDLYVGMKVKIVVNTSRYSNGAIGEIVKLNKESVVVHLFAQNRDVKVEKRRIYDATGKSKNYIMQIPIAPAYAVTIHCVQGQTLDKAYVHADCFERKQLYTGLSRVRSKEGLTIVGEINYDSFGRL